MVGRRRLRQIVPEASAAACRETTVPPPLVAGLTLLGSYLVGAVPFGYLVARLRGVNIFAEGSGNIGATNVGRVLGRKWGVLVFLLDFAKGALPPLVAQQVAADAAAVALPVGAGLLAFLGHLYPIYLRFRGGKGVATATGVIAVLLPGPALVALLVWIAVLAASRYVSLASVTAALALPLVRLLATEAPFAPDNRILTLFCLLAAGLIAVRHRSNLSRLLQGNENRLKESRTMVGLSKVLHVLALGLWFGSAVFFSLIAAPVVFRTFTAPDSTPAIQRDAWVPLLKQVDEKTGSRLAGAVVGPLFPWYFLVQGVCAVLALVTALAWAWSEPATVHRVRAFVLGAALLTVAAGWPLVQKVTDLRAARYAADPAIAEPAQAAFGTWHVYSLLLNLVTIVLVTVAMALAAWLPGAGRVWIEPAGAAVPPETPVERT